MPIPDSTLGQWSHHHAATASVQAHTAIRDALVRQGLPVHEMFLQGSYKSDTNLRRDSDVDLVVQLDERLRPRVAALTGPQLQDNESHKLAYGRWQSFRRLVLAALRARFGQAVTPGRKSLKIARGPIPAAADVVVTLKCGNGIALYIPDEHRWAVSYPQQHHSKGARKERGTGGRYKRATRMFKAARNHLIDSNALAKGTAPSYFVECLLYNVPNGLFRSSLGETYVEVVNWLWAAELADFTCQNQLVDLFGSSKDQWSVDKARAFIQALARLWNES
ncbi:MAG: nucleotidyltransferase [Chloroflexota bacterium]|nr:nucleotidyltransferase [Chloroflexota bacterium]MDE2885435.1 nucleotidyltransferase [Chloroflexota bacterium]